jgi:hypothetical protein
MTYTLSSALYAISSEADSGYRSFAVARSVALQVAFERQILKPVFHLTCYRLWV